jgi:hypothetical protein
MTTRLSPAAYIEFWREAHALEIGLHITLDPKSQTKFINELYNARKELGGYEDMIVFQPAPIGTVFICHKDAQLPE